MSARVLTSLPAMLAAVAIVACSADHAPSRVIAPNAPFLARLPGGGTPHKAEAERVEICKSYLMKSGATLLQRRAST